MLAPGIGPALATPIPSSPLTRMLLAPNPGPMTLDGTHSYLVAAPGQTDVVVIDPGPLDERHLTTLAQAGRVALVVITHQHADHTAGSARLADLTGAPVRAFLPAYCIDAPPLRHDETIHAAGVRLRILATPGHTADSICVHLPDDGPSGSVLTGDTILGSGSTVIGHPDGTLRDYLRSLTALQALGPATVLPAHGPIGADLAAVCAQYLQHRRDRLGQVRAALQTLGPQATVAQVTDRVYPHTDARVRFAAEASVRTQLAYLAHGEG